MSKETASQAKTTAVRDGIVNPAGLVTGVGAGLYFAFLPVTSYICKADGVVHKIIDTSLSYFPGGNVAADRVIPAFATIYILWAYGITGSLSATGQAMSRPEGLDNRTPRAHLRNMSGLPLRLWSAHSNLVENFPAWALAAGLAQLLAPGDREIINLLGLSALLKTVTFYFGYLVNAPPVRSLSHVFANAAVVNVCWRLALGAA